MRFTRLALMLAAFAAPTMLAPSAARANIEYPWCAVYGDDFGGSNCGFSTIEQCRLTISGMGGFCEPNPFYRRQQTSVRKRKRAPKH